MAVVVIKRSLKKHQQFQPHNLVTGISHNTGSEHKAKFTEEALKDMRRRYSLAGQVKAMSTRD